MSQMRFERSIIKSIEVQRDIRAAFDIWTNQIDM